MLVVVIVGYFVPFGKPGMSQTWIICWGFICFFNALIDLVLGIIRLVQYTQGHTPGTYSGGYHSGGVYGNRNGPTDPNVKHELTPMEKWQVEMALAAVIIALLIPVVELLTAWMC